MNLSISIQLGNDAMQTTDDVLNALANSGLGDMDEPLLRIGESGVINDANGNSVGRWDVRLDKPTTIPVDVVERDHKANDARLAVLAHDARARSTQVNSPKSHYENGFAEGLERARRVLNGEG